MSASAPALVGVSAAVLGCIAGAAAAQEQAPIDYARDVRPILTEHCFKCHGPDGDARKRGLRLDTREGATGVLESGVAAIVPGDAVSSELMRRVRSDDDDERMPPPSEKKPLSAVQIERLARWIDSGAGYAPHWAFVAPARPELPAVQGGGDRVRNEIDRFVLAALERRGLQPSPEADRETLIRRVTLDLIGLPPTAAQVDAFLADDRPGAYERVVDRLLASPHYGERWARRWLDLARYADTNGFEKDRERSMWPWRDWVIAALNDDMPFDRFTIEQIAGDMLPGATREQKIATGFHRNTMLNEEGGVDVEEFRFAAMVDRVGTTATTWLGLTLACAQCHTHKYDPFTHTEFYGLFAFLDNTDEIVLEVPDPEVERERRAIDREIAKLRAALPEQFPPPPPTQWVVARPVSATSKNAATLHVHPDGSVRADGEAPDNDVYVLELEADLRGATGLRIEALVDAEDPARGPGRTDHGNFVITDVGLEAAAADGAFTQVELVRARADFSQDGYPVHAAIDEEPGTGWAIHSSQDGWRRDRTAIFESDDPFVGDPCRLRLVLAQQFGGRHTLHRFRVAVGRCSPDPRPIRQRRQAHLRERFEQWVAENRPRTVAWRTVVPVAMRSQGLADFAVLDDDSVLVYGNNPDRDTTWLTIESAGPVSAIRLEALPHESLPATGPGRSPFFPEGGFMLSDVRIRAAPRHGTADPARCRVGHASASYEHPENRITHAVDEFPDTGWTNQDHVGRRQHAVFRLAQPVAFDGGVRLELQLSQHSIHNNNLGRFRVSITDAAGGDVAATDLPADIEAILARDSEPDPSERSELLAHFLETCAELAPARQRIEQLSKQRPLHPTTLAFYEREPARRRDTHRHERGEYLRAREVVVPHVPAALHPLPAGAARDRAALARWLVDPANPLTARVVMNRHWEAFFGRGIVRTTEDFGTRGAPPSHPRLLDWLATEFVRCGWSQKSMHRSIVTSATYRQSSRVRAAAAARDPENVWLARAPRLRLDAELVRDAVLRASGLLSTRIGGPSVFPSQPEGIGELSYGRLDWTTSVGEDRYRRGLYTFMKRTAPYAMFAIFDAPSGESCVPRRARTNTPLQALTMLNDAVFIDAARALGRLVSDPRAGLTSDEERVSMLFRRCVTRRPTADEADALVGFYRRQRERFASGELDATAVAGPLEATPGANLDEYDVAAWTTVARVVLNLDEVITRS